MYTGQQCPPAHVMYVIHEVTYCHYMFVSSMSAHCEVPMSCVHVCVCVCVCVCVFCDSYTLYAFVFMFALYIIYYIYIYIIEYMYMYVFIYNIIIHKLWTDL